MDWPKTLLLNYLKNDNRKKNNDNKLKSKQNRGTWMQALNV